MFCDKYARLPLEHPLHVASTSVPVIKADFNPDYFFKRLETSGSDEEVGRGSCLNDRSFNWKFIPLT